MPYKTKAARHRYEVERERERRESGHNRRRWRKDPRRGKTPEKDLKRMYRRFVEDMDPSADLREVRQKALEWFDDSAGATRPRIEALQKRAAADIAARIMEEFDLPARADGEQVRITTKSGGERIVKAVIERYVRAPPSWGEGARNLQLIDALTGKLIGQRRVLP